MPLSCLRPFTFLSGAPFQGPDDVIVDDVFANAASCGRDDQGDGSSLSHLRHCGAGQGRTENDPDYDHGRSDGDRGQRHRFYIKVDDPANDELVIKEIHSTPGLEDYPVQTMREWLSLMTPERLPGFNLALNIVTGIAMVVGFLVIFQSMYTAVLERTREIGILKSMGASKLAIVMLFCVRLQSLRSLGWPSELPEPSRLAGLCCNSSRRSILRSPGAG